MSQNYPKQKLPFHEVNMNFGLNGAVSVGEAYASGWRVHGALCRPRESVMSGQVGLAHQT